MDGARAATLAMIGGLAIAASAAAALGEPDRTSSNLVKPRPAQAQPQQPASSSGSQQGNAQGGQRGQGNRGDRGNRGGQGGQQRPPQSPPPAASPAPPGRATYVEPPRNTTPDRTRSDLVVRPRGRADSDRYDRDGRYDRGRWDRDRYDRSRWSRDDWHDRHFHTGTRYDGPIYVFPSATALDSPLSYSYDGPSPLSYSYPQPGIGNYSNPFEYNRGPGGVIIENGVVVEDPQYRRRDYSWLESTPPVIVSPPLTQPPATVVVPAPTSSPPAQPDDAALERWRADQRLLSQINPRYDVSDDFGAAVRAAIEGEYSASVSSMRRAAAVNPEALIRAGSTLRRTLRDDQTKAQQTRYALSVFRSPPGRVVSDADAAFMVAALSGALGETTTARSSVSTALLSGDTQSSTLLLNHALSTADEPPPSPWQQGTPVR